MALDREPTLTKGNIEGTPLYLLQKGEILKKTYLWKQNSKGQGTTTSREVGIVFGLSTPYLSLKIRETLYLLWHVETFSQPSKKYLMTTRNLRKFHQPMKMQN